MSRFFLGLVLAAILSLAAAQSITFTQTATNSAFPPREYAACTQTPASTTTTPTLFFFGGLNVTLTGNSSNIATAGNSYTDGYYNDAWSSTNLGATWSLLTGSAAFAPQGWNGAVRLGNGSIVYIGGGGDSSASEINQVWISSNGGASFAQAGAGPWAPRENFGITGTPGTNNVLVALGNTNSQQSVDDIWFSTDGGGSWNQTCHYTTCPLVATVNASAPTGQVHGPTAVGLYNGYFLLMGGYGNDPTTGSTTWVTNQVAISSNAFVTWQTFTAPWSPRAQQRAVVDADNFVYVYGGVINTPLSGSGTQYTSVPGQVYYGYFQDLWYSPNAASGSGATWTQLTVSGITGANYPGLPYSYSSNPNAGVVSSQFYTNGAIFNPCLGFGYSSTGAKQLVLYTGLYAGYRQNQQTGVNVAYPGVFVGTLSGIASAASSSTGGGGAGTSTGGNGASATTGASLMLAAVLAVVAMML